MTAEERTGQRAGGVPDGPDGSEPGEGERLSLAVRAFEAGDYRLVRELARALAGSADPGVAERARKLALRVAVDPVQVAVLLACATLFLVIATVYLW